MPFASARGSEPACIVITVRFLPPQPAIVVWSRAPQFLDVSCAARVPEPTEVVWREPGSQCRGVNVSKTRLEGLFVDELARLQPTAGYMREGSSAARVAAVAS